MGLLRQVFRRGLPFPARLSFILESPLRRLLMAPGALAERLELRPGAQVLEVGCGSGFYSVAVARRMQGGRLELLDLQPEMLAKARRKLGAGRSQAELGLTAASAHQLPFEDGAFDVVFLVTVFGEIPSSDTFLSEAHRVLRSGGRLSISEQLPDPDFNAFGALRRQVEAQGFALERKYGPPWAYTANFRKEGASLAAPRRA